jgi:hypothetical protein
LEVENSNLMKQINTAAAQNTRVTARVIGVLKKLTKTYGGSILTADQMLKKTQAKVELYCAKLNLTLDQFAAHYRVFVPYNNQMP